MATVLQCIAAHAPIYLYFSCLSARLSPFAGMDSGYSDDIQAQKPSACERAEVVLFRLLTGIPLYVASFGLVRDLWIRSVARPRASSSCCPAHRRRIIWMAMSPLSYRMLSSA